MEQASWQQPVIDGLEVLAHLLLANGSEARALPKQMQCGLHCSTAKNTHVILTNANVKEPIIIPTAQRKGVLEEAKMIRLSIIECSVHGIPIQLNGAMEILPVVAGRRMPRILCQLQDRRFYVLEGQLANLDRRLLAAMDGKTRITRTSR